MLVQPAVVPNGMPREEEIAAVVHILHLSRVGGPSGMRLDYLKMRFREATGENNLDIER